MLRWLLFWAGVVLSGACMATSPAPSGAEFATLPPYCKQKGEQFFDPIANQMWSDTFGKENWLHMHHYCYGLNYLVNRYYKGRTPQDRAWMLGEAVSNISYTLQRATLGFPLLPEMHLNRGKAYRLLGRGPEAISDWLKATALNPEYVAAYIALADYYSDLKQADKALEMASEGLRHVPASKALQRRYQELGGKLPFPDPYKKPVEQNVVAAPKPATDAAATSKASPETSATEMPKPAETEPTIGMPGNPYCRFCPDTVESKPDSPQSKP